MIKMSGETVSSTPKVSIVIPCRNEKSFIGECLDSIIANDFPKECLEVLVVDGMSDDGTRAVLDGYVRQFPFIKLLDNPGRITPIAFNIGVQHAAGSFVMIMSAHATMARDVIAKCVQHSERYGADNVGGSWKIIPRNNSFMARAITLTLSHPFGVGNASYRTGNGGSPRWVDTAAYGCYRREVFQRVGLFNEKLIRGQDMELNLRLKRSGGKTLLVPDVVIYYYARSTFVLFCKHSFSNGVWAIIPFLYSDVRPVSWRHLVPLGFVLGLAGSVGLAFMAGFSWIVLGIVLSTYGVASVAAAFRTALKERDPRYALLLPFLFGSLHLAYGFGSFWGLLKIAWKLLSGQTRKFTQEPFLNA